MSSIVVGLDIGTCFVRGAIGLVGDDKSVEIVGVARKASSGFLRNGTIVNLDSTKQCIKEVIDELEQSTGMEVHSFVTGIGGVQIESSNSRGSVAISSYGKAERAITVDDIKRVIDCANSIKIPLDRSLIHVIPQQYIIDGTDGFQNPLGTIAYRLDADVHIITASRTAVQNLRSCAEQSDYNLDEVMLKTLACAQAVMVEDEKKLGSILIDIGGGTTDVVVILKDAPICTCSIPIGANLVTNDIAVVKGIPSSTAEKIKIENGCCWPGIVENDDAEVIIPGFGSRNSELTSRVELCEIIYPRMEEIFKMVKNEIIQRASVSELAGSIILTGGGAQLNGAVELAQSVFETSSVRLGYPQSLGGIEEKYRLPEFATCIGLILAHKDHMNSGRKTHKNHSPEEKKSGESTFQRILKKFF